MTDERNNAGREPEPNRGRDMDDRHKSNISDRDRNPAGSDRDSQGRYTSEADIEEPARKGRKAEGAPAGSKCTSSQKSGQDKVSQRSDSDRASSSDRDRENKSGSASKSDRTR